MKKFLAGLLAFCLIIGAADAGTTIWGSTDRGPAVGTMRFPVDTGSSSGPGYLSVSEVNTYVGANFPSSSTLTSPLINTAQYPSTMAFTGLPGEFDTKISTHNYVDTALNDQLFPAVTQFTVRLANHGDGNITAVYNNGTAGVGATLTTSVSTMNMNGVALVNTNRVLIVDQTATLQNGIYVVSGVGSTIVFTRATDYDSPTEINGNVDSSFTNPYIAVTAGTNAYYLWWNYNIISAVGTTAIQYFNTEDINGFIPRDGYSQGSVYHTAGQIYVADANAVMQAVTPSGDVTISNTGVNTLATVNSNVGLFGSSSKVGTFVVNGKGLITSAGEVTINAGAGLLTGTTLASGVTASSLTSFGASPVLGTPASGNLVNTTHIPTLMAPGFSATTPVTGQQGSYWRSPCSGTITGWDFAVDAGTATVQTWKIATGTASPTVSNSISTAGVSISSNTAIHSTTTSDFTTTTVTQGDILAFNLSAVATATKLAFQLEITCN